MDRDEAVDDHRHLEDKADREDECRDERDVVRRTELVFDDVAPEIDQELKRVREEHEVAEQHADDEEK